jgi:hypothetical protein
MPTTRWRVVWGLKVTMDSFWPTRALIKVLLPGGRKEPQQGAAAGGEGRGVEERGCRLSGKAPTSLGPDEHLRWLGAAD